MNVISIGGLSFVPRALGTYSIVVRGDNDVDDDGMPDPYERANGLDPTVNDALDDKDKDTLANFFEFFFGTKAQIANGSPIAVQRTDGNPNGVVLRYTRSKDADPASVAFECTTDLLDWIPPVSVTTIVVSDLGPNELVESTIFCSAGPVMFVRMGLK